MSGIVHKPATEHACTPGWTWTPMREDGDIPPPYPGACYGTPPEVRDYPRGTVWRCDCDQTWVSRGPASQPANLQFAAGMAPPEWKRESSRARRKRERRTRPLDPGLELRHPGHFSSDEPCTLPQVSGRPAAGASKPEYDRAGRLPPASTLVHNATDVPERVHAPDDPCPAPSPADPVE